MSEVIERPILTAFVLVCERFADVYGAPLPHEILELGDPDEGWHVLLNASRKDAPNLPAYHAAVQWNGFPAGLLDPSGGVLAAGELANEETFLAWLPTAQKGGG